MVWHLILSFRASLACSLAFADRLHSNMIILITVSDFASRTLPKLLLPMRRREPFLAGAFCWGLFAVGSFG